MSGLCENCFQGHVLQGTPSGSFQDSTYFHNGSQPSKKAVVVLTDVFGLKLINPKLITDEYSNRLGCDVWCPDMFEGSPPISESQLGPLLPDTPGVTTSLLSKLKLAWNVMHAVPGLVKNRPSVADSRVKDFVTRIRQEKGYEKIGAIGFCFGGAVCVRLCAAGVFDSGVIAHPGHVSLATAAAIKVPTLWVCAEEDMTFPPKLRNGIEAILKRQKENDGVEYEFRDYKGTTHGFAARPNLGIPEIKKAFIDVHDQGVAWFEKTLN